MVKKTTAKDGDHVVTMREVAKAAGVSIKTVSNVVNDYEFVSDATRAKVHKAIDELGYVINVSARNLRRGSTGIIALAIPDLQLSYFAQLSSLIITEAKKLGLRVIVEPTLYSREGELDALHGSQTAMVDGLIYSPLELGPDDAAEVEVDYPLVLIGERIFTDKVDHIATENVEGAKRATSYLLQTDASASPWSACTRARRSARPRCDSADTVRHWRRPACRSTRRSWCRRSCGTATTAWRR